MMSKGLIKLEESILCVIDIQERLIPHIANRDEVIRNTNILIQSARELDVPILLTEQYPKGLGQTIDAVAEHLDGIAPIEKTTFGCMGCAEFTQAVESRQRHTLILCGIETHVCILQTALAALDRARGVVLAADATGSRTEANRDYAIERMRDADLTIATTEMILMEWLIDAKHPKFKALARLMK